MKIIAHRGALNHYTENTLDAIVEALKLPFDGVEFDVRRSRDGHIFLMHDATVNRTTDGTGRISSLTSNQIGALRTLDNQTVPELKTVMNRISTSNKIINIEIKSHGCAEVVAEYAKQKNVYVSSPIKSELEKVKKLVPSANLGFVTSNPIGLLLASRDPVFSFLTVHKALLNPKIVRYLISRKKQIWVFPVKLSSDISAFRNLAVHAVFSDVEPK